METRARLLQLLNQREFMTGPALGESLGISRAAVHKHISSLRQSGLPVDRIPGRGYRLAQHIVPLNDQAILDHLPEHLRSSRDSLLIEPNVDSTSDVLRRLSRDQCIHRVVCLAESQHSGRGRRGNRWVASPFRNLMMSIGWIYDQWPRGLTALAPTVGIIVVDALTNLGASGLGVKWPNDIVYQGRKLGGVLIDVSGEANGVCTLIVGIGLNVNITQQDGEQIGQPWTDLINGLQCNIDRNRLAAGCIEHLFDALSCYQDDGFDRYLDRWAEVDVLRGSEVWMKNHAHGETVSGTVVDIDRDGALRIRRPEGNEISCYHGEVSVRAV